MNIRGKNILITQLRLQEYAGSEIVTLELAEFFSKYAKKIYIATTSIEEPIKKEFKKIKNLETYALDDPNLTEVIENEGIDIAWIQHSMIPRALLSKPGKTKFIFHHMSPYSEFEFPLFPEIENRLADKILCNSQETKDEYTSKNLFDQTEIVEVFNNPAPSAFENTKQPKSLRSIFVVSNHIPEELREGLEILSDKGLKVTVMGAGDKEYRRVNPEDIWSHDVVISIGKTVQYSIVAQRPVYCYDRFGGPGYLDKNNYDVSRQYNFSGRGFARKEPELIAQEIIDGYSRALEFSKHIYKNDREMYIIDNRINNLTVDNSRQKKKRIIDTVNILSYIKLSELLFNKIPSMQRAEYKYKQKENKLNDLNQALVSTRAENNVIKNRLNEIIDSRSYKLSRAIVLPMRLQRAIRHRLGKELVRQRNIKNIKRTISEIYGLRISKLWQRPTISLVIRSIEHPTSSTFIRILSPLSYIDEIIRGRIQLVDGDRPWISPHTKAIIVQRTAVIDTKTAIRIVNFAKKNDIKIFVDTDDAFGEIDKNHPQYELQKERIEALEYIIEHANETWFSTEKLSRSYKTKKSEVIRNTIDSKIWSKLDNKNVRICKSDQPLRMIYMGTRTHDGDFKLILPSLERLEKDFPGEFSLDVIGVASGIKKYPWLNELHPSNGLYPLFTKWFNTLEPYDIGLSPLENSEFNSNKSDIKCLDYMSIGVRPVVSDTVAYANPELDNLLIRVKNTNNDWYLVLRDELVNRKKYRRLATSKIRHAYNYVSESRNGAIAGEQIRNRLKHYSVV